MLRVPVIALYGQDLAGFALVRLAGTPEVTGGAEFAMAETRFSMLARSDPEQSRHLLALAQADADERWQYYEQLAGVTRAVPQDRSEGPAEVEEPPPADDGGWLEGGA